MVAELLSAWEHLDILVNSAGIIRDGLFATMSASQWRAVIDTNLSGVFYAWCLVGLIAGVGAMIGRWCLQ